MLYKDELEVVIQRKEERVANSLPVKKLRFFPWRKIANLDKLWQDIVLLQLMAFPISIYGILDVFFGIAFSKWILLVIFVFVSLPAMLACQNTCILEKDLNKSKLKLARGEYKEVKETKYAVPNNKLGKPINKEINF